MVIAAIVAFVAIVGFVVYRGIRAAQPKPPVVVPPRKP